MDINFQDRIDEYLLHPDRLSEEEKSQFLSELEADPKKRVQFELTRDVRLAVTSRARKMSVWRRCGQCTATSVRMWR